MDPNATLATIRAAVSAIITHTDADPDYSRDDAVRDANELAEAVEGLDYWIKSGGFLPAAWKRDEPAFPPERAAIDTIVEILNDADAEDEGWNADHFDAIAKVLDVVRTREPVTDTWVITGPTMQWADGSYHVSKPTPAKHISFHGAALAAIAEELRGADNEPLTKAANAIDDGLDRIDTAIEILANDDEDEYDEPPCSVCGLRLRQDDEGDWWTEEGTMHPLHNETEQA